MNYLEKPSYCQDAIATDAGWVNPKTGELLISIKDLPRKIRDSSYRKEDVPVIVDKEEVTTLIRDDVVFDKREMTLRLSDDVVVESQQNGGQVKRRGRPKKTV